MKYLSIFAIATGFAAMPASGMAEAIAVVAGAQKTVALPYKLNVDGKGCRIVEPKSCTRPQTRLGTFTFQADSNWDIMPKKMEPKYAKCINPKTGKIGVANDYVIRTLTFKANKASADKVYGYEQVTVYCTMNEGEPEKKSLQIKVLPKSEEK